MYIQRCTLGVSKPTPRSCAEQDDGSVSFWTSHTLLSETTIAVYGLFGLKHFARTQRSFSSAEQRFACSKGASRPDKVWIKALETASFQPVFRLSQSTGISRNYINALPPSTGSSMPVMKSASSLASQHAALPMSLGVAILPSGICVRSLSRPAGVSVPPRTLVTLSTASASASASASAPTS